MPFPDRTHCVVNDDESELAFIRRHPADVLTPRPARHQGQLPDEGTGRSAGLRGVAGQSGGVLRASVEGRTALLSLRSSGKQALRVSVPGCQVLSEVSACFQKH